MQHALFPLLLLHCTVRVVFRQGGVFHTSSGGHWTHDPGATIIVRESYFHSNTAGVDSGGVGYLGEFGTLTVEGDGNMFERNTCSGHGGVFASTSYTSITVEGGTFQGNGDGQVSTVKMTSPLKHCQPVFNGMAGSPGTI